LGGEKIENAVDPVDKKSGNAQGTWRWPPEIGFEKQERWGNNRGEGNVRIDNVDHTSEICARSGLFFFLLVCGSVSFD
jgi:hypothetical protein